MLNRFEIVYIDDILIYSNTMEEHVHQVREVLKRLIQYQLYAKAEKCEFRQTSVSFLGYVISSERGSHGREEGFNHSELATTEDTQRVAMLSGVLKLLSLVHSKLQLNRLPPHKYGKEG